MQKLMENEDRIGFSAIISKGKTKKSRNNVIVSSRNSSRISDNTAIKLNT